MSWHDRELDVREAFQSSDADASRLAHDQKRAEAGKGAEEDHSHGGGYLKSAVFGGLDGIITTFATVTTVAGASLSPTIILILGVAHLYTDILSLSFAR